MATLQKQISLFTEDESTSSQVGFRVNRTASQESDSGKKTSDICGPKCAEQLGRFSHVGLWAKTFSALLIGMEGWYSTRCKLTWKLRGTKYSRMYFQLAPSTPPTEETGFGLSLLKTPTVMDGEVSSGKKNPVSGNSGTLAQEIMSGYEPTMRKLQEMLPTPLASEIHHPDRVQKLKESGASGLRVRGQGESGANGLMDYLDWKGILPTPTADDNPAKNTGKRNQDGLQKRAFQATGKTSQLNPLFVNEMMGFPINYLTLW